MQRREEMPGPASKEVVEGQAVYTPLALKAYDLWVLGLSNSLIWSCPTSRILALYNAHVSANHLDVGVGSGYFLDRCRFPSAAPRVALMDLNPNSLGYTARRIARYRPETYQRNVLEPIALDAPRFDTIALNYLLHCVPGSMDEKAVAFDHLRSLLNPGGKVFGSTLLQGGVSRSRVARRLMDIYNRKGVFHNTRDSLESLEGALRRRFAESHVEVVGCAALFWARG
jgi:SAM-dependent methyltransferase